MSIYEYDEKEEQRRMYKAAYSEGEIVGEERGIAIGEERGKLEEAKTILTSTEQLCKKNIANSTEEACEILGISPEKYEAARKLAEELTLV